MMNKDHGNNEYTVYLLITDKNEHKRVAISKEFELEIQKIVEEYGSLEKVPVDKTIRGVFLEEGKNISTDMQENDITINQLRNSK